jgi:hypothetical protein
MLQVTGNRFRETRRKQRTLRFPSASNSLATLHVFRSSIDDQSHRRHIVIPVSNYPQLAIQDVIPISPVRSCANGPGMGPDHGARISREQGNVPDSISCRRVGRKSISRWFFGTG